MAVAATPLGPWARHQLGSLPPSPGVAAPGPASDYDAAYEAVAAIVEREQAVAKGGGWLVELWDDVTGRGEAETFDAAGGASSQADGAQPAAEAASSDYSGTNVQVQGIDEGDLVKTDGRSIFIARGRTVAIVAADGAGTGRAATIEIDQALAGLASGEAGLAGGEAADVSNLEFGDISDMLVSDGVLVVLVSSFGGYYTAEGLSQDTATALTAALLYDVSDPAAPSHAATLGQTGWYVSSRLMDQVLYLVSEHSVNTAGLIERAEPATYVPCVVDGSGRSAPVPGDSVAVLPNPVSATYAVATSADIATGERLGEVAVLGGASTVYMSAANLYLAGPDWAAEAPTTNLARISLDGANLALGAQGAIPGTLLNQFSLDEFDGYLRLVASNATPPAADGQTPQADSWLDRPAADMVRLSVLDASLQEVGAIQPLVAGEDAQSVRFMGEIAYVVTFKQVDPLFAVDLADPAAPRVLSELKIPGFSSYLHPWGEGQLLGLGLSGSEDGLDGLMKLSMFDVSDPAAVWESGSRRLDYFYSAALYDHRAIWADAERNLIGFPAMGEEGEWYAVFSYAEGGFQLAAQVALASPADYERYGLSDRARGVRIGSNLYICAVDQVVVLTLDGFEEVARIAL
ncbi:MAG: beta-propeller domain-containing protein [Bifidobacteriaceae bacterium]|nr:beta-propeller domain-containing protein [Bifidobacteriaceae bacterium]